MNPPCDAAPPPPRADRAPGTTLSLGFLGRVIHEACAEGMPVLIPLLGGMPEIVAEGQTGSLAQGLDAASLAQAIRRIHEQGRPLARLQPACLDAARDFAFEHIAQAHDDVLHAAAERRAPAAWIERASPAALRS